MPPTPLPDEIRDRADLEALLTSATNYEELRPRSTERPVFKLDRVRAMLASVGDPHLGPTVVHVAGSKGKGTTARLIDAALRAGGRGPVGLYTSPHLEDLSERIRVDGRPADDGALARAAQCLLPHVRSVLATDRAVTFFELLTGMAWLVFREAGCRSVVLETGLGGRLDATNVCAPAAVLVTTIEREHTEILGDTIREIAGEKAGILKAGVPAATAAKGEALEVMRARAEEVGTSLAVLDDELVVRRVQTVEGPVTHIEIDVGDVSLDVELPMAGSHHAANAALAAWAALQLGVEGDAIQNAWRDLALPGIAEPLGGDPLVVVDGAHTPVSAARTREAVDAAWPDRRRALLVALLAGKDADAVTRSLAEGTAWAVATRLPTPRTMDEDEVAAALSRAGVPAVEACADPIEALRRACEAAGPGGLVLATGSVRLAGLVRAYLSSNPSRMLK